MLLEVRQEINEWYSQINQQDREFLASKWVTIGTIKVELG
jgi:hypothetical protein